MKQKNKILIAIIAAAAVITFVLAFTPTGAQISSTNYWKKLTGNSIVPINSTWEIGSSTLRIPKIWATNVDITTADIGTVAVSGMVSGNLIVGGAATSTITGDGTPAVIGSTLKVDNLIQKTSGGDLFFGDSEGGFRFDLTGATTSAVKFEFANGSMFKIDQPDDTNPDINISNDSGNIVLQPTGGKLVIGGTATSTITGDGTLSTIGGDLRFGGFTELAGSRGISFSNDAFTQGLADITSLAQNTLRIGSTQSLDLDWTGLSDVRTFAFPDQSGTFGIFSAVPTASTTPCVVGEFAATSSYIYVCVSPNQWTRATSTINW